MTAPRRYLFVVTIVVGSFLLFLIQPMVARLALPRLGGAPNVWNSAMLVYQALLLSGYAYAHLIGRLGLQKQFVLHLSLFLLAGFSLPIALVDWASFGPGLEVLWVPALLFASIGPVFFVVSAQAPLVQRWYAASPEAGDPYPLYAGSNLGSFAGLLSYPLLVEPNLTLSQQTWLWTGGYIVLGVLVLLLARTRWQSEPVQALGEQHAEATEQVSWKRILLWLMLAAVPSGLMLSTTTMLTTDIFAMPLLWVLPLGLYLLSYVPAFSENRRFSQILTQIAPLVLLLVGGLAMGTLVAGGLLVVLLTLFMLFIISVALHGRLYDLRPDSSHLTLFYLVMSAGGVLGGLFTALIAPIIFDWVWEHPILVLAAAMLIPLGGFWAWQIRVEENAKWRLPFLMAAIALACAGAYVVSLSFLNDMNYLAIGTFFTMACLAILVKFERFAFVMVLLLMMIGSGGARHLVAYESGDRNRSYFGVYNVKDNEQRGVRELIHGTTKHGSQFIAPDLQREPTTYYGRSSGVGMLLDNAAEVFGAESEVGIVGLGAGTLACYRSPEQRYRYYEIDPAILDYSNTGRFTFLSQCSPAARTVLGDARLELERERAAQYDVLVVDAFSSDAIPVHLLTLEAFQIYNRAIRDDGALIVHISNRFLDLEPVLASAAQDCGCSIALRLDDNPVAEDELTPSRWVVMTRDSVVLERIMQETGADLWRDIGPPLDDPWTDDYASILTVLKWKSLLGIGG